MEQFSAEKTSIEPVHDHLGSTSTENRQEPSEILDDPDEYEKRATVDHAK